MPTRIKAITPAMPGWVVRFDDGLDPDVPVAVWALMEDYDVAFPEDNYTYVTGMYSDGESSLLYEASKHPDQLQYIYKPEINNPNKYDLPEGDE